MMKLQKNTAKITMTLFITLTLSFLTIGCGSTKPDAAAENTESDEATEATVEETETEEASEATEPTEAVTEEADTEDDDDDLPTGYVAIEDEYISIVDFPSLFEVSPICQVRNGDTVKILDESYNEQDQVDFYKIQTEAGKRGYIPKKDVQLAE